MVLDGLPEGVDDVYEWVHVTDQPDDDPVDVDEYLAPDETEQAELDDVEEPEETSDYAGESRPRVVNTQFMGRRNYAREPGRTTDFDW